MRKVAANLPQVPEHPPGALKQHLLEIYVRAESEVPDLHCEVLGITREGIDFRVLNGAWHGTLTGLEISMKETGQKSAIHSYKLIPVEHEDDDVIPF